MMTGMKKIETRQWVQADGRQVNVDISVWMDDLVIFFNNIENRPFGEKRLGR